MKGESRTIKSLKNAEVALFYYVVLLLVNLWSRKIFLDYIGVEVMGLNTTASNLFGYLSLAEMGIGFAITYFLYKPLNENEYESLNKIVSLQGWIYRRVATFIITGALVMMCFFPWIFSDIKVPLWYAYVIFSVLMFDAMLGYFINFKSIVLTADQKGYKITRVTQGFKVFINILQIAFFPIVPNPFLFYIFTSILSSVFGSLWLSHVINKEYPWLKTRGYRGKSLLKEYPGVLKKTKQLFVHKLGEAAHNTTNPIVMYAFSTLSIVGAYSNYLIIIGQVHVIIGTLFSSVGAAVGSLIATDDKHRIIRVFWELYDSRFCISAIAIVCLFCLVHPFMTLWIGKQYILGKSFLLLMLADAFMNLSRRTVDQYINGHGLFQDIWAPALEALINILGAVTFGYLWGFRGVLLGGILAQLIIIYCWKPYMLFKKGLKTNPINYFIPVIKRHILLFVDLVLFFYLFRSIIPHTFDNYIEFFAYAVIVIAISSAIIISEFYLFSQGVRDFIKRTTSLVCHW